mmetsp:Transcript_54182/g.131482  ORF Transcript_54182/g.131482 Transcript_54182/m.131482 type:complete len:391 (+) Transcript_54182:102-1274(+)|eukprot:CAMPEP_0113455530 /NCGR_PEP_ID=MMETSP0014_2-20120614/8423_1 /TAXON_ID=2857 /ORGANISM="Nitzschia sp." /LENGTH=390 /DNA_ID=CAMNT_0000346963 /DNA_START=187 /DNA_END=1359 /DNA_ORIENTATION=+ /assembly_acc=CAM_ASM_000159
MFHNRTTSNLQQFFGLAVTAHTSTHLLNVLTDIEKLVGKERLIKAIYPKKDNKPTKQSIVILKLLRKILIDQVKDSIDKPQHFGVMTSSSIDGDPSFGEDLKGSVDTNSNQIGEIRQFLLENDATKNHVKATILREIDYRGSVQEAYGYEMKPTKIHQNLIDKMSTMNDSDISAVYWTIKDELICLFVRDYQLHDVHIKEMRDVLTKTQLFFAGVCVNFDRKAIAIAKKSHELFCLQDDFLNQQLYRLTIVKQKYRHPRRLFNVGVYAANCAYVTMKAELVVFEKYNNCKISYPGIYGIKKKRKKNYDIVWMSQHDGKLKSQNDENKVETLLERLKYIMDPETWSGHQNLCDVDVIQAMCTIAMKYERDDTESDLHHTVLTRVIRVPEID